MCFTVIILIVRNYRQRFIECRPVFVCLLLINLFQVKKKLLLHTQKRFKKGEKISRFIAMAFCNNIERQKSSETGVIISCSSFYH